MSRSGFRPRRPGEGGAEGKPYPLPPALARLPVEGGPRGQDLVERDRRDRILLAALEVFGTKGLAAATVADLTSAAGVSRATFYKTFGAKEECFESLHDEVLGWLEDETRDAAAGKADWPDAVVAACGRLIALLDEDPRVARVCGVESLLGGPRVLDRHREALAAHASGLAAGRPERDWGKDLPRSLEEVLVAGAVSLAARTVVFGDGRDREGLGIELAEMILICFLGPEDARRAVGRGS